MWFLSTVVFSPSSGLLVFIAISCLIICLKSFPAEFHDLPYYLLWRRFPTKLWDTDAIEVSSSVANESEAPLMIPTEAISCWQRTEMGSKCPLSQKPFSFLQSNKGDASSISLFKQQLRFVKFALKKAAIVSSRRNMVKTNSTNGKTCNAFYLHL